MASSDVQICNLALSVLGHNQISTLSEGTEASKLCALHYEPARDAALSAFPWNFAAARATLSPLTSTPNHEFSAEFQLPVDCLQVLRIFNYTDIWRVEGRKLLAQISEVQIAYTAKVTEVGNYPPMFTQYLLHSLAALMAPRLTDNQTMARAHTELERIRVQAAMNLSMNEGGALTQPRTRWADARVGLSQPLVTP